MALKKQVRLKEQEIKVIEKFKSLLEKRFKPHRIILFGSRAKGDAEEYSDMDLVVIVEKADEELKNYISDCAWEAGFEYGIVLVPVVFTRKEWEEGIESQSLFVQAVKKEGISL